MKYKRTVSLLFWLLCSSPIVLAQTLTPVSIQKLDSQTTGIAWLDDAHVVTAGGAGVRLLSLRDGAWSDLISTRPIPAGLPDPLSVATDGRSIVAGNGFTRAEYGVRADNKKRLFARSGPAFTVIDVAVSGNNLYVLGWPSDAGGANNADGVAVWRGGLSPLFEQFQPLHRIQSGAQSVGIFNESLPIYGGALAVESDGALDVITASESGVFQYGADGALRRRLGSGLGELVIHRMHDINVTYSVDPLARYREVVNRQPTVDDLVVTPDGPAIVVRIAGGDSIGWELWYPNANRVERRVKLGISRRGPFGHLSCDARGRDLACVYQSPETPQAALAIDQTSAPSFLARFTLPSYRATAAAIAARK